MYHLSSLHFLLARFIEHIVPSFGHSCRGREALHDLLFLQIENSKYGKHDYMDNTVIWKLRLYGIYGYIENTVIWKSRI